MKSAKIFWQSQSGNSYASVLAAKDALEENGWSVRLHHMLSDPPAAINENLVIFSFPVHNFKPAALTREFIKGISPAEKMVKALALVNCTGLMANVPYCLRKLLKEKNVDLAAAKKVRGAETYILLRKYMGFSKRQDTLPDKMILDSVRDFIRRKLDDGMKHETMLFNPLSVWHWLGRISPDNAPGKAFYGRSWIKEKCTLCGNCYTFCPSRSIKRDSDVLSCNEETCVGCCGCFNICPVSAWQLKNYEEKYFLKNKKTPELIKAVRGKERA